MARLIPIAEDITVEADSGGHTDNRPLLVLLPLIIALAEEVSARHGYTQQPRVGVGGGLGTPAAGASAVATGAAFVVPGSVERSAVDAAAALGTRSWPARSSAPAAL